jgi:hypothetical protein
LAAAMKFAHGQKNKEQGDDDPQESARSKRGGFARVWRRQHEGLVPSADVKKL